MRTHSGFTLSSRLVATSLVLSVASTSTPALAQTPVQEVGPSAPASAQPEAAAGDDLVVLQNGGMVRGKLLEVVPQTSVTIVSAATGQTRTIPWSEVAEVRRAGVTEVSAPPAAPAPEPAEQT